MGVAAEKQSSLRVLNSMSQHQFTKPLLKQFAGLQV